MTIDRVLSLSRETTAEPVVVQQNDRQSRVIRLYVLENTGTPLPLEGLRARMLFRKNGATSPAYEAAIHADGWIQLTVPEAVTKNAGNGEMQLVLQKDESLLHSFTLPFVVKGSLSFVGETESPADDPMAVNWKNLPGKPTSFPPAGHTHTPTEAGALAVGGTAANAAKLGGKAALYYTRPYNWIENGNFLKPINQRAKASYSGTANAYTIDRWLASTSVVTISLDADGITIDNVSSTAANGHINQRIEGISDGEYTMCVSTNLGLMARSFMLANGTVTLIENTNAEPSFTGVGFNSNTGILTVQIGVRAGSAVTVYWAALYEGAYKAGECPPYVPKGLSNETAACMRYYQLQSRNNVPAVDMRPPMRLETPTITTVTGGYAYSADL